MQVRSRWLIPGRVIFAQAVGDLTHMDFDAFVADIVQLSAEATGELHIVQDLRFVTQPNMNLGNVRKLLLLARDFSGWYLQFGQHENRMLGFLALATARLLSIRTKSIFKDYTALRRFLMAYDPTLEFPEVPPMLFTREELREHLPEELLAQL